MRRGQITEKDMSVLREADATKKQQAARRGTIRDYSLKHRVEIAWDLNDEAMRDQMFRLKIDEKEVILDAEEVMRLLRWV